MSRKIVAMIIFLLLFIPNTHLFAAQESDQPQAKRGELDFRAYSLNGKVFDLEGEWEFYWNQLLVPEDFQNQNLKKEYIQAPNIWSKAKYSGREILVNEGYGTYRLQIIVDEDESDEVMSLYVPSVASAFQLWVNGELLLKNGVVGTDRDSMKPNSFSQVVSFAPQTNQIEIIMQLSNFSQRKGGMWSPLRFGMAQEVNKERESNLIREVITASGLIVLGAYHISLYLYRAMTKLPLFLGLFCLFAALRSLLVGERLLIDLFPSFSWEFSVKLEYLTFYIGLMIIFVFLSYLFSNETNRKIVYLSIFICTAFSLTTLFPAYIFTHFLSAFQTYLVVAVLYWIYVVILAMIRKREGAVLNFLSIFFFILAMINDIFYYHVWIRSIDLTPIAGAFFLFLQTLVVAKKSATAFNRVEQLSVELQKTNASLEQEIKKRTQDLLEKNAQLQKIERSRQSFFSSVAHELGKPLQSIQGYIQLIQSKPHSEEQSKYLNIVFEKTKLLRQISKDLMDLAKMEEGQFKFFFEETDTVYFLEHLYDRFKYDIEKAERISQYTPPQNVPKGYTLIVSIDDIRIEQVFSNLINNAIKFTPIGGTIHLKGKYMAEDFLFKNSLISKGLFQIEVMDNGFGIDKKLLPFIFDRFVKNGKEGTGLGLAICQEIIRHHGGTISVESEKGKGSRFFIKLPAQLVEETLSYESDHSNRRR